MNANNPRGRALRAACSLAILLTLILSPLAASGGADSGSYTEEGFVKSVSRALGHGLDDNEKAVAQATWLWYDQKCDHKWDKKGWGLAVESGAKNCRNDAMLAAAKAGKFGEKLLKALVVAAGDAAEGFSDWVEKTSARYGEKP